MRIRTLLQTSLVVAALMVIGLTVTSWFITAKLARVSLVQERAQAAAHNVSNLLVLTHEYALYSEERAAEQWKGQQAAIILNLEAGANDVVPVPAEALTEAKLLSELFEQMITALSHKTDLHTRQRNLLLSQLQATSQSLADSVNRWGTITAQLRHKTERVYHLLAIITPTLMFLILVLLTRR